MGSREKTECMYRGQLSNADPSPKRYPQHKDLSIHHSCPSSGELPVVTMTMYECHPSEFFMSLVQAIQKDCNPHTSRSRSCPSWMPAGIDDQPKRQVYGTFKYGTVSSHNDGCGDILSSTLPPSMLSTASEPSDDISSCKSSDRTSKIQSSHVSTSPFADSVSSPQYFSTNVPSPGGASFPTLNSSFSKIHFAVLSNDSFASTISSDSLPAVSQNVLGSGETFKFPTNYFSDSFANASSSSFSRLHLGGARIDRALGELELNVLFGGATPPQYG